jgi:hypothetical protein
MTRTAYTTVIDAKTNKASEPKSAAPGHMTLAVPGTTLAVLPQRKGSIDNGDQGTIRIVDLLTAKGGPGLCRGGSRSLTCTAVVHR